MPTVVLGITLMIGLNDRAVSAQGAAGSEPLMKDAVKNITSLNGEPAHPMLPTMFYVEDAFNLPAQLRPLIGDPQVDVADFRDVDGGTVPSSWIVSQRGGANTPARCRTCGRPMWRMRGVRALRPFRPPGGSFSEPSETARR